MLVKRETKQGCYKMEVVVRKVERLLLRKLMENGSSY
jgi:hypothetical protein